MIEQFERRLSERLGEARGYAVFRMLCYIGVSVSALMADVTVYVLMLGFVSKAAYAAAFGFIIGVVTHYLVASRVAFPDRLEARGSAAEAPVMAKFFAAGATGLAVTPAIVWLLADSLGYHPYLAKAVAVGVSFVCVFAVLRFLVLGNFLKRADDAPSRRHDHVHRQLSA